MASDARVWSQAEQERVRRLAVAAMVEQGMSVAVAGRVFGVTRQTVSGWVNAFRQQGERALAAGRRGRRAGEQQALPPWLQGQLVQTIRGHNPDQLRLPFFLWTREAVCELIRSRYGIELALTTVGQYLKRWGFTPQKPVQRAFEQNPVAVSRWLECEYPAIEARAKREGARILWAELNPAELQNNDTKHAALTRRGRATPTSSSTAPAATTTAARNNQASSRRSSATPTSPTQPDRQLIACRVSKSVPNPISRRVGATEDATTCASSAARRHAH